MKEIKETEKGKEELKFSCEKCDYKTKRNVTLMKHMNTRHYSKENSRVNKKENSKEISREKKLEAEKESKGNGKEGKKCENCENCDNCEFIKNHDTCQLCRARFEAARENLEIREAELKEKLAEQSKRSEKL